ncbi:MAG: hypothetical protein WCO06_06350 [Candidatus Roizmanbacteria bacterium]
MVTEYPYLLPHPLGPKTRDISHHINILLHPVQIHTNSAEIALIARINLPEQRSSLVHALNTAVPRWIKSIESLDPVSSDRQESVESSFLRVITALREADQDNIEVKRLYVRTYGSRLKLANDQHIPIDPQRMETVRQTLWEDVKSIISDEYVETLRPAEHAEILDCMRYVVSDQGVLGNKNERSNQKVFNWIHGTFPPYSPITEDELRQFIDIRELENKLIQQCRTKIPSNHTQYIDSIIYNLDYSKGEFSRLPPPRDISYLNNHQRKLETTRVYMDDFAIVCNKVERLKTTPPSSIEELCDINQKLIDFLKGTSYHELFKQEYRNLSEEFYDLIVHNPIINVDYSQLNNKSPEQIAQIASLIHEVQYNLHNAFPQFDTTDPEAVKNRNRKIELIALDIGSQFSVIRTSNLGLAEKVALQKSYIESIYFQHRYNMSFDETNTFSTLIFQLFNSANTFANEGIDYVIDAFTCTSFLHDIAKDTYIYYIDRLPTFLNTNNLRLYVAERAIQIARSLQQDPFEHDARIMYTPITQVCNFRQT